MVKIHRKTYTEFFSCINRIVTSFVISTFSFVQISRILFVCILSASGLKRNLEHREVKGSIILDEKEWAYKRPMVKLDSPNIKNIQSQGIFSRVESSGDQHNRYITRLLEVLPHTSSKKT